MNEILKKDISIKIGSVLMAILLWVVVITIDNPYEPKQIPVPVKVLNRDTLEEKGLFLKNEKDIPTAIMVTVSGRKEVTETLSPADFVVELDFSKISSSGTKRLQFETPYLITAKKDVKIASYTPHSVEMSLEKILNNSFPVSMQTTGSLKPGYKIVNISYSPESISLEDQESIINTIDNIKAVVDVTNASETIEKKVTCKVFNKSGKELAAFKNLNVDVNVEIGKEVPVTIATKGKPAADYMEVQSAVDPPKVVISGPAQVLNSIADLKTESVNIENATAGVTATVPVKLPSGVKIIDGTGEVSVTVSIEKLEKKTVTITPQDIGTLVGSNPSFNYEIRTEGINLELRGRQSELQNLTAAALKPSIDVSSLDAGTHKVKLIITTPSQVQLVSSQPEVEVKVTQVQ